MKPDHEGEGFDGEPTLVDAVHELADVPTRKVKRPCGHCGTEGAGLRGRCQNCGLVPAAAREACLGCKGRVVYLGLLRFEDWPRTYEDAVKLASAGGAPVCLSCPPGWVCTVAPGSWSG